MGEEDEVGGMPLLSHGEDSEEALHVLLGRQEGGCRRGHCPRGPDQARFLSWAIALQCHWLPLLI